VNRAGLELKMPVALLVVRDHLGTDDVGGHQVGCELNT
jgi:hypothetical protein